MPKNANNDCIYCLSGCSILALICGIISYIVYGIIFLVQDYNLWSNCNDSALWQYVLVAIILMFNKSNFKETTTDEKTVLIICAIVIELGLAIWGAIELFDKCDNCPELRNSNLWKFGLATFIIQISLVGIVILIFSIFSCINHFQGSSKNTQEILDKHKPQGCSNV